MAWFHTLLCPLWCLWEFPGRQRCWCHRAMWLWGLLLPCPSFTPPAQKQSRERDCPFRLSPSPSVPHSRDFGFHEGLCDPKLCSAVSPGQHHPQGTKSRLQLQCCCFNNRCWGLNHCSTKGLCDRPVPTPPTAAQLPCPPWAAQRPSAQKGTEPGCLHRESAGITSLRLLSLSRRQRSCPRRPRSAPPALPPPADTARLSHRAAGVGQGVPIAAGRAGGETSKTSGHRGRKQPGSAVTQGWGHSLSHGRQSGGWPTLGDKCPAASRHRAAPVPPSGGKAPAPSPGFAFALQSELWGLGCTRGADALNRNVPLGLPFYCLINNGPRIRSRPSEGSTLLLPCNFKKAFIKIKKKPQPHSGPVQKNHRKCFRSGSAAARKQTVLSHPHLQQTAKSISQPLLIKKKNHSSKDAFGCRGKPEL